MKCEPQTIIDAARRAVHSSGLTYHEIAEETGLTYHWIAKFSQGIIPDPGISRVLTLLNTLHKKD